jgi:hypothetical protein
MQSVYSDADGIDDRFGKSVMMAAQHRCRSLIRLINYFIERSRNPRLLVSATAHWQVSADPHVVEVTPD